MMRYVCAVSYNKNDPETDRNSSTDLRFYASIKHFLKDVGDSIEKHQFHTLYSIDGREVGKVVEEFESISSGVTSVKGIFRFVSLRACKKEGWVWSRVC